MQEAGLASVIPRQREAVQGQILAIQAARVKWATAAKENRAESFPVGNWHDAMWLPSVKLHPSAGQVKDVPSNDLPRPELGMARKRIRDRLLDGPIIRHDPKLATAVLTKSSGRRRSAIPSVDMESCCEPSVNRTTDMRAKR